MKTNKSKTNILTKQKQSDTHNILIKKNKNSATRKSSTATLRKLENQSKKNQKNSENQKDVKSMHSKTKSYLEKMLIVLPEQNLKKQIQSQFCTLRKNSSSAITDRVESRMSKRTSVTSNQSHKNQKSQCFKEKENEKNLMNLQEVKERQNQQCGTTQKKNAKKLTTKKHSTQNLYKKASIQFGCSDLNKKNGQKSKNLKEFQGRMSRYLKQKDIFSRKVSQQKSNHSKKSKNSSSQKISQKKLKHGNQTLSGKMKNKERQNLLQIYQFYKKTFDINFNNYLKRNKNMTKQEKKSQHSSKSALRPFYSSNIVQMKQRSNQNSESKQRRQIDNRTKISVSGELNGNDSYKKSKRSGSVSIIRKQNQNASHRKSSILNSKSNINSQSSTKDNLFCWKGDSLDTGKVKADQQKRIKKSSKQLIVYKQNHNPNDLQNFSKDSSSKFRFDNNEAETIKKQITQMQIGSSNIQVLKWSGSKEKQLKQITNTNKQEKQKKQFKEKRTIQNEVFKALYDEMLIKMPHKEIVVNKISMSLNQQQLDVTKLIKKRSNQMGLGNLDDLSSISLYQHDGKDALEQNQFSTLSIRKSPKIPKIDDIDFQF